MKSFIVAPQDVGAVMPSSDDLADFATDVAGVRNADVVVEFGPGTGAITKWIVRKLKTDSTFFAMEINPDFVKIMRERFPDVRVYNDSAANTRHYLAEFGHDGCDVVVSGLPWTAFNDELQITLLDAVAQSLRPGGRFVTYMYLTSLMMPSGVRFRRRLAERLTNVNKTRMVWRNVPPAFVLYGEKPQ